MALQNYNYWITVNYRESCWHGACNGILLIMSSPIRGETFVTRKITKALTNIAVGLQDCLYLGILMHLEIGDMLRIMFVCSG